jgi:hypothetical protein
MTNRKAGLAYSWSRDFHIGRFSLRIGARQVALWLDCEPLISWLSVKSNCIGSGLILFGRTIYSTDAMAYAKRSGLAEPV